MKIANEGEIQEIELHLLLLILVDNATVNCR